MGLLAGTYILQLIAYFTQMAGISTNHWFKYKNLHLGLFRICTDDACMEFSKIKPDFLETITSINCLGSLLLFIALIMATVFMCKETLRENKNYRVAVGILVLIGGLLTFIGPFFGVKKPPFTPDYSLYITLAGGVLSLSTGILYAIDIKRTIFGSGSSENPGTYSKI
ncbi:uncharacterized protein LOC115217069 [Argonauta hians]